MMNEQRGAARCRRFWPAVLIIAITAAAMAYCQHFGVIDNGTSNGATAVLLLLGLLGLAVWMACWAPFARSTRWRCIAAGITLVALLALLLRTEGFDGNFRPIISWRWVQTHELQFANSSLNTVALQSRGTWSTSQYDYPGFLGLHRDGYVPRVLLETDWKAHPPVLLWKKPIGGGYSAFAIVGRAAITLEQRGDEELVTCYDVETGELRWLDAIEARHHDAIGGDGPASTPTVHDGRVYALGGTGVLRCLDGGTGKRIWMRNVLADVGTDAETDHGPVPWGRSASPLIVDDLVIVPGGGPLAGPKVSLVAYNTRDGEIVWKGGEREISYSSPSLVTYSGVRQIVIVNEATITGHDPQTGTVLWEVAWEGSSSGAASASQTVQFGDDRFFVSKGYSKGGGAVFRVKLDEENIWKGKELWHNHRVLMTKFNNVVIKDSFAYGLSDGVLQCVDLKDGKRAWAGSDYGHGQIMRVRDLLLITGEDGSVSLVALDPAEFHEFTQFQAIEGKTWNNPALAASRFIIRNGQEAACYALPLADPKRTDWTARSLAKKY